MLTISESKTDYIITDMAGNQMKNGCDTKVCVKDLYPGVYFVKTEDQISKFLKN